MRHPRTAVAIAAAAVMALAACTDDGGGGEDPDNLSIDQFPRDETLYTTGAAWGPPADWNPVSGGEVTGLRGLGYEPLYLFNPNTQEMEPWLAESGEWTGDLTYQATLRDGITWSDGEQLTAEDVKYTVELGQLDGVPYSNVWDWLESVEVVDDLTVEFTFLEARHQEWDNFLFNTTIVPEHVFSEYSEDDIVTGANEDPVVSGPYTVHSHDQDRIAWVKRDDWWATEALGLEVQPTYIVDIVNTSNEVTLNMLMQGEVDLSNNFLPGISDLLEGDPNLSTYFSEPPYMAPANTAMLIPNTTMEPLDDAEFRRAMAFAISPGEIVDSVYSGIVAEANPTGLLPIWENYYDQEAISESGFQFEPSEAVSVLEEAGYEDSDGDGFVETLSGDPVELTLNVPAGWTDWEEAARAIASDLRDVGINVTEEFLDAGAVDEARDSGEFELVLNNQSGITNSPWGHYRYLFQLPVQDVQTGANFARFESQEAWDLTQQLAATATDDPEYAEIIADLQRISLEEMPSIPIWYNGAWAQASNAVWTNWPTQEGDNNAYPVTWNGFWTMGSIYMLTELEPAG